MSGSFPDDTFYNDILEYNVEDGTWNSAGSMDMTRGDHAVSVINFLAIADYCK